MVRGGVGIGTGIGASRFLGWPSQGSQAAQPTRPVTLTCERASYPPSPGALFEIQPQVRRLSPKVSAHNTTLQDTAHASFNETRTQSRNSVQRARSRCLKTSIVLQGPKVVLYAVQSPY